MGKQFVPAPLSEDPYGEKPFQFPLMKAIEDYAEENSISILAASKVVVPEYALKLPWRDDEYFKSAEEWQKKDLDENAPTSIMRQFDKFRTNAGGMK